MGSDKFARMVRVESKKSTLPFSDNFFDILPGESKTITIKADENMSLRCLAESIFVYSLTDIQFSKNILSTKFKQLKVYMSPTNIGNAVYHGKLPKDTKLTEE